jgi:hypothetical protein
MPSAPLRGRCQPWRLGRRPPRSARSSAFVWSSHTARLNQAHARAGDEQPPSHIPLLCASPSPVPGGLPDHRTSAHPHQCCLIRDGVWIRSWSELARPSASIPSDLPALCLPCAQRPRTTIALAAPVLMTSAEDGSSAMLFLSKTVVATASAGVATSWAHARVGRFRGDAGQTLPMPCPALRGDHRRILLRSLH